LHSNSTLKRATVFGRLGASKDKAPYGQENELLAAQSAKHCDKRLRGIAERENSPEFRSFRIPGAASLRRMADNPDMT
jgi:hypothetical protein